jgi:hypothetical protein
MSAEASRFADLRDSVQLSCQIARSWDQAFAQKSQGFTIAIRKILPVSAF